MVSGRKPMTWEALFAKHAHKRNDNGCIEWTGSINVGGYGVIAKRVDGRVVPLMAHRYAWSAANGPIPDGMKVCHRCDNPRCVNIDHLFLGTQLENMRDMIRKDRQNFYHGGRPFSHAPEKIAAVLSSGKSVDEIAAEMGVTRSTVFRWKQNAQQYN